MPKTIYETFKDFPSFYKQLKPRFASDFRTKDLITNIIYSTQIYETHKHDRHYGDSDTALNRIFSQIVFDCAEIRKKELIWNQVFTKLDQLREIETKTQTRSQKETKTTPKQTTNYQEPLLALQDLAQGAFGYHNRTDWLKTTQKSNDLTILQKDGYKVATASGGTKIQPNWTTTETEDNAGIARILGAFQYIQLDLTKYLLKYRKFFYRSYGLEGEVSYDPDLKRHAFKSWEEIEEEAKPEEEKKTKIQTEETELSYSEWKKEFKLKEPTKEPSFQLYTVYRLEKYKEKLLKELKKTSGVFKDKLNLRLTFCESLLEGYQKEIKMPLVGNKEDKLSLSASDEEKEKVSYWAKVNTVIGFEEFKDIIADFVDGYNELVEDNLTDKIPAQMYLLLGKPGVGKSYISTVLAEALNRPIEVISMNGKKETSIFFGVPQEWAGAGVGEILKAMVKHKDRAPIILLDEFEKSDKGVQQVLGNLTDKTLNKKFKDVFFDYPVPINEVIWFCTANYPEQIEPFIMSRLTPIPIAPLSYNQRLKIAQDLIAYNFSSYKIKHLVDKFSESLIKKCLTREWGVRGIKDNIERIAYKVFLLNKRGKLPSNWESYKWPIVDKEEVDGNCPYAKDRSKSHKEACDCFQGKEIEGWVDNMD
jgi:DNA replication protein DnaC